MSTMRKAAVVGAVLAAGLACSGAWGQADMPSKVPLSFDRYHTSAEFAKAFQDLAAAYPEIASVRSLGKSLEGREMLVLVVQNPRTGAEGTKPMMWIDGAVHANEVQAAEAVLYTAWYLTKAYGVNKDLTELVDQTGFYLLPMVNPDSRDAWFKGPSTPHNHRGNVRPVDDDQDGLFDEDGPDDLDGDGHATRMWKEDPEGRWERDKDDPRVFRRRPDDKGPGGWTMLGEEGIDNDGDGLVNEDDPGGDDMNRNWPAGWLPGYAQHGAGPYPFSAPETRAIGDFMAPKRHIAAVQSYHNAGGMILRGPGAGFREWAYPGEDVRVYDQIAQVGEQLLPYYRSMVIHKDLYTVHGGFVNWAAESLGIFSFTNELWTEGKYFQRETQPDEKLEWLWRDRMVFGQTFTPYKEYMHPQYGKVLIGGQNKWSSRNTPTFMLEEECHRNFAFTMFHADQMPRLKFGRVQAEKLKGEGASTLWAVTAEVKNERAMPTRSRHSANKNIGEPDLFTAEVGGDAGAGKVVASGRLGSWLDESVELVEHEPGRVLVNTGVPSRGILTWRFYIEGTAGTSVKLKYEAEKARMVEAEVKLGG